MRHPDYDGRMLTCCAEQTPESYGGGITFACTKPAKHCGDHEATVPGGRVIVRWEKVPRDPFCYGEGPCTNLDHVGLHEPVMFNIRWPESVSKWYALRHPLRMRHTIEIVALARLHDWIRPS